MTSVTTLYIATVNSAATTAHDCRESALRLSAIAGGAARGGSWTPLDVRGQLGFNSSSRRNQHPSFALFEQMRRFRHLAVFKNGRHLAGDACPPHPISMLCSCCRQVSPPPNRPVLACDCETAPRRGDLEMPSPFQETTGNATIFGGTELYFLCLSGPGWSKGQARGRVRHRVCRLTSGP